MGTFPESYTDTKIIRRKVADHAGRREGGGLGSDNGGSTNKRFAVICL